MGGLRQKLGRTWRRRGHIFPKMPFSFLFLPPGVDPISAHSAISSHRPLCLNILLCLPNFCPVEMGLPSPKCEFCFSRLVRALCSVSEVPTGRGHPSWVSWANYSWQERARNIYSFKPMETDPRLSPEWPSPQCVFLGEIEMGRVTTLCEWQGLWGVTQECPPLWGLRGCSIFLTARPSLTWCSLHRKCHPFNNHHKQAWFSGQTKKWQTATSMDCGQPETVCAPCLMWRGSRVYLGHVFSEVQPQPVAYVGNCRRSTLPAELHVCTSANIHSNPQF